MYLFELCLCLDVGGGVGFLGHIETLFLVFWGNLCTVFRSGCTEKNSFLTFSNHIGDDSINTVTLKLLCM